MYSELSEVRYLVVDTAGGKYVYTLTLSHIIIVPVAIVVAVILCIGKHIFFASL